MRTATAYACPACALPLKQVALSSGAFAWACPGCGGVLVSTVAFRREAAREAFASLWGALQVESYAAARACPCCGALFRTFPAGSPEQPVQLDACPGCLVLWFDAGELQKVGVTLKVLPGAAARANLELARDFQREQAEQRETASLLSELVHHLLLELRRAMRRRWF